MTTRGVIEVLNTLGFGSCVLLAANIASLAYIENRAQRCPRYEDEWYNSARRYLRRSMKVLLLIAVVWCSTRVMAEL
jgi:hypothetical protein